MAKVVPFVAYICATMGEQVDHYIYIALCASLGAKIQAWGGHRRKNAPAVWVRRISTYPSVGGLHHTTLISGWGIPGMPGWTTRCGDMLMDWTGWSAR